MIGIKVKEEDLCRERALCCGIGGGFSHASGYHPIDITLSAMRSLRLAEKTKADAIAVYCVGCMHMLSSAKISYPFTRMPIYHIVELIQMAIGESPLRRNVSRAWLTMMGIARNQLPKLISRQRFYME